MAARADITSHLSPFARPPERRFRRPRLDTAATSAAADLIGDVMGLAVRSIVPRRVTGDIIANVEIDSPSGEKFRVAGGGGVSLTARKHRPVAKAANFPSFSQHITQIAPDERKWG